MNVLQHVMEHHQPVHYKILIQLQIHKWLIRQKSGFYGPARFFRLFLIYSLGKNQLENQNQYRSI